MNRFRILFFVALGVWFPCFLAAEPSVNFTLVVQVPPSTPENAPLFLGANSNGWNPGDLKWKLPPPVGGTTKATFALPPGFALEFKVTRGSWETVEKDLDGQEIPNRTWFAERDGTLTINVEAWRDQATAIPSRSTVTGRVDLVTDGPVTPIGDRRILRIRLPEGYDGSEMRFPVLYLMDGQNIFDAATSFAGEWKVDETLALLEKAGRVPPSIVVGIDNAGGSRLSEYSPYIDAMVPHPTGKAFTDWLVKDLKPWIDLRYRTLADRTHTSIGGSSMGGLISVSAALRHPGVFGRVASFSGAFWLGNRGLLADLKAGGFDSTTLVYVDIGTKELGSEDQNRQMVADSRDVAEALKASTVTVKLVIDEGAAHNELAWARRFGPAYLWLMGTGQ